MKSHPAHHAVSAAVHAGKIAPQPCEECGAEPAEAHHPDYAQPLAVRWLCKRHHTLIHMADTPKGSGRRSGTRKNRAMRESLMPVVQRLRAEGKTLREIADTLMIAPSTAFNYAHGKWNSGSE